MTELAWFDTELVPTGRGSEVRQTAPTTCPNGHRLGPNRVRCGYRHHPDGTTDSRHATWQCVECGAMTYGREKEAR